MRHISRCSPSQRRLRRSSSKRPRRRAEHMGWSSKHHGAVTLLTFSRPPQNYADFASIIELGDLLQNAAESAEVKVVMLAGGVNGVFVNHAEPADLARAGQGSVTPEELGSWA